MRRSHPGNPDAPQHSEPHLFHPIRLLVTAFAAAIALAAAGSPAAAQTTPTAPTVTSDDFPDGTTISPMVGEVGTLTISTTDTDIAYYSVDFSKDDAGPWDVTPEAPADSVTLSYMPTVPGRDVLTVRAVNTAGESARTTYSFRVSAKDPVGSWNLDEPAGSTTVTDADGTNPGRVGCGVALGADGPGDLTAAQFDGTEDAYIDTTDKALLRTDEGFAASTWVRVDDLSRDQAAVSLNGSGEPGFVLGYRSLSETTGEWAMTIPDTSHDATTDWTASGGSVRSGTADEWVHVLGVYDGRDQSMTLYVNGTPVDTATRETVWNAGKSIQIGRAFDRGEYGLHWSGGLAEARVFNRVVPPAEADDMVAYPQLQREGYWQFNTAADGESPEYLGGEAAQLAGDASIYTWSGPFEPSALNGNGHLVLDGDGDYASLSAPMVDTSGSFSLTARARLDTGQPDTDMTVLAVPGQNESMVEVRYNAELHAWELVLSAADSAEAEQVSVTSQVNPNAENTGQGLAVVHDGALREWTLWVEGVPSEPLSDAAIDPWTASGGLQIGRSLSGGEHGSYFAGAIDEVRAYTGALDERQIQLLSGSGTEHPGI